MINIKEIIEDLIAQGLSKAEAVIEARKILKERKQIQHTNDVIYANQAKERGYVY